jgi:hypothetical protein
LENLSQQSLPEPKEIVDEKEKISGDILIPENEIKADSQHEDYEEERMIDIPDLFRW